MGLNTLKRKYLTAADMSTDIEADWIDMSNLTKCSFSFVWSGSSPSGTLYVQASNDPDHSDAINVNLSNVLTVSGNSGTHLADITEWSSRYIRLFYSASSGTGTAEAWVIGKGDAN